MPDIREFQSAIGYEFRDISLLEQAMTHSSYSGGKNNGSNERLEFLGDSVSVEEMIKPIYNFKSC